MRVAVITSCSWPVRGGMERLVEGVTSSLAANNDVMLLTNASQTPSSGRNYSHSTVSNLISTSTTANFKEVETEVSRIVSNFKPDIILLADGNVAPYSGALSKISPLVSFLHGNDVTSPWAIFPFPAKAAIIEGLRLSAKCFVLSTHVRDLILKDVSNIPVEVIPAGFDEHRFYYDRATPLPPHVARKMRSEAFKVVTCSRIAPRKGHIQLLKALKRTRLKIDWIVVGAGKWRDVARLRCHAFFTPPRLNFINAGPIDDNALRAILNQADLFALTPTIRTFDGRQDSEGYGLVYLEAAACGTASIASNVGGCVDAVLDGVTGALSDPIDPEMTAAAITGLLHDRDRLTQLSSSARARAEELGGWSSSTKCLESNLLALIEKT